MYTDVCAFVILFPTNEAARAKFMHIFKLGYILRNVLSGKSYRCA